LNITFRQFRDAADESPVSVRAGTTTTIVCNYWASLTASGASATVYKTDAQGTLSDVTSTVMPSGSVAYGTNQLTLKPLTAISAGYDYLLIVTAVIGTDTVVNSCILHAPALTL